MRVKHLLKYPHKAIYAAAWRHSVWKWTEVPLSGSFPAFSKAFFFLAIIKEFATIKLSAETDRKVERVRL